MQTLLTFRHMYNCTRAVWFSICTVAFIFCQLPSEWCCMLRICCEIKFYTHDRVVWLSYNHYAFKNSFVIKFAHTHERARTRAYKHTSAALVGRLFVISFKGSKICLKLWESSFSVQWCTAVADLKICLLFGLWSLGKLENPAKALISWEGLLISSF